MSSFGPFAIGRFEKSIWTFGPKNGIIDRLSVSQNTRQL